MTQALLGTPAPHDDKKLLSISLESFSQDVVTYVPTEGRYLIAMNYLLGLSELDLQPHNAIVRCGTYIVDV